jgi:hypothetical protein
MDPFFSFCVKIFKRVGRVLLFLGAVGSGVSFGLCCCFPLLLCDACWATHLSSYTCSDYCLNENNELIFFF